MSSCRIVMMQLRSFMIHLLQADGKNTYGGIYHSSILGATLHINDTMLSFLHYGIYLILLAWLGCYMCQHMMNLAIFFLGSRQACCDKEIHDLKSQSTTLNHKVCCFHYFLFSDSNSFEVICFCHFVKCKHF